MTDEALRPCDCGAEPTLWLQKQTSLVPGREENRYFVRCPNCGARTRKAYEFAGVAILRWNEWDLEKKRRRK